MEPDMSSWLLVQPHSLQDSREAAPGPRGAPGSVWEGPPGRTRQQEGQGTATGLGPLPLHPRSSLSALCTRSKYLRLSGR